MMADGRARRAAWVATRVLPHEPAVRKWLQRSRVPDCEIDDLVQQAYCRLAELDSVEAIARPGAYFFEVVRLLFINNLRRARVVRMESVAEIETLNVHAEEPSPERVVAARRELDEVLRLIDLLPPRCSKVFRLRKVSGLSQRQIAQQLGLTETVVENEVAKGLRLISRALRAGSDAEPRNRPQRTYERTRILRAD